MHSCIYRGIVRHQRHAPGHRFQYTTAWVYLDLDEIDGVVQSRRMLSDKRYAPSAFWRGDHLGDPGCTLAESVKSLVKERTGLCLGGPIRLLTQLRHFGVYFSPLTLFYCFDAEETLVALVAEVSNTPWNERHCYVLWEGNRSPGSTSRYCHPKEFHVSPFMGMDSTYQWRVRIPGDQLHLALGCQRNGQRIFHADLHLHRYRLTDGELARTMLRRPVAALHILAAIYYQALRLWMKKCQFYPHPRTTLDPQAVSNSRPRPAAGIEPPTTERQPIETG